MLSLAHELHAHSRTGLTGIGSQSLYLATLQAALTAVVHAMQHIMFYLMSEIHVLTFDMHRHTHTDDASSYQHSYNLVVS